MHAALACVLLSTILVATSVASAPAQSARLRIDSAAVERLRRAADAAHSDAVVLWRDGRPLLAAYSGGTPERLPAMSITKSVVSLAVGRLVTTGAIGSLDEPVAR